MSTQDYYSHVTALLAQLDTTLAEAQGLTEQIEHANTGVYVQVRAAILLKAVQTAQREVTTIQRAILRTMAEAEEAV